MAVIEYGPGDHTSGFVGFRVARTLGAQDHYRQSYFSTNKYSYDEAKKLAYELDAEWEQLAKENSKKRSINEYVAHRKNVHTSRSKLIASGFRAYIGVEKRKVGGILVPYIFPCFLVKPLDSKTEKVFRCNTLGYERAYARAVSYYLESRNIPPEEGLALLARQPDKKYFTDVLRKSVLDRGVKVTKKEIMKKLEGKYSDN